MAGKTVSRPHVKSILHRPTNDTVVALSVRLTSLISFLQTHFKVFRTYLTTARPHFGNKDSFRNNDLKPD